MLNIYNTLTRKVEKLEPISGPKKIKLYSCGPTPHDFAHIGNFRTFIWVDLLKRYLRFRGFDVNHVMNITDVDDKTIKKSHDQKKTLAAYTEDYTQKFFDDLKSLGIDPANDYPRATNYIPEMIEIIQGLLDKGVAYKGADGSVYYEVKKFSDYGKLAGIDSSTLAAGASGRMSSDEYTKENVSDFALWKAYDPAADGDVVWDAPFGRGRPGWHIECSAMAIKLLGETFDIHVGGIDLLFPHHQNEVAQSEAFTGKQFAKYWMHCEHLLVEGKKMSKSLGNFFTLRDIMAKGYDPMALRFVVATSHYRQHLNFTFEALDAAWNAIRNITNSVNRTRAFVDSAADDKPFEAAISNGKNGFVNAMDNDLNAPEAAAAFIGMVNQVAKDAQRHGISPGMLERFEAAFNEINSVLGIHFPEPKPLSELDAGKVDALVADRAKARGAKDWAAADRVKAELTSLGVDVVDRKSGTSWYQVV